MGLWNHRLYKLGRDLQGTQSPIPSSTHVEPCWTSCGCGCPALQFGKISLQGLFTLKGFNSSSHFCVIYKVNIPSSPESKLFMKALKRTSLKMEPCRTLLVTNCQHDVTSFTITLWSCPISQLLTHHIKYLSSSMVDISFLKTQYSYLLWWTQCSTLF